ncbi:MAG: hypothetical protein KKH22_07750 [Proteobacteria bacterium]|nr:hypothetical protein [Pseudomonadota bacterium]
MTLVQAIFEQYWPRWQQLLAPDTRIRLEGVPLSAFVGNNSSLLPDIAEKYLNVEELARWNGFSQEKRRSEWLGGRLAAKSAGSALLGKPEIDWPNLVIRTEEDGRPYLTTENGKVTPFISISHSGPLAAAIAANRPCGLDIQLSGERILRVRERFASLDEETILRSSLEDSFAETEQLTMLWTTKEAVRKMVRASPLLGLLEIRLLAGQGGHGTPQDPLLLTFTSGREPGSCPPIISVLCFFADNLAWAMGCLPNITKE